MRYVFLDPDGTHPPWVGVIVCWPTGVTYGHQCGGTTNDVLETEGYFVPVAASDDLRTPFHRGRRCHGDTRSHPVSPEQIELLTKLVSEIAWWSSEKNAAVDDRHRLALDTSRLAEVTEAWVPVILPNGRGYLLWKNCD